MTRPTTAPDPALIYVYEPQETCGHEHTEPVWPILVPRSPKVGDEVTWLDQDPWFRMCTHCTAVLPLEFGCTDCEWVEVTRLCSVRPEYVLGQPCEGHAR